MYCRETTLADLPRLKALWKEGFGDTDADIDRFFEVAYPHAIGFTAELENSPRAALYALPLTITDGAASQRCAYLYAVSTARAFRGRGLCRTLMAFAEQALLQRGFSRAMLVPGEPSLFGFYAAMGYRAQCCHEIGHFPLPAPEGEARKLDAAVYGALRERLLKNTPHVTYDAHWLRFSGAAFYELNLAGTTGCAAVLGDAVLELLPDRTLLGALSNVLSRPDVLVRTPGANEAFSMAKPLGAAASSPDAVYLAFAYE